MSETQQQSGGFGDSPFGLEDLEMISIGDTMIGVPHDSPPEFRKNILAGASAFLLRLSSIDYTRRRYSDGWILQASSSENLVFVRSLTKEIKKMTRDSLAKMKAIPNKPDMAGQIAAEAALIRLQMTFRAAIITTHMGLHFETSSLSRMILEQLAWIFSIYQLKDETLFEILPTKSINRLSRLFANTGRIYGSLSATAHIRPDTTLRYIDMSGEYVTIKLTSSTFQSYDALTLMYLADIYCVLCELIYIELVPKREYISLDKNKQLILKKNRLSRKTFIQYRKQVDKREKQSQRKSMGRAKQAIQNKQE